MNINRIVSHAGNAGFWLALLALVVGLLEWLAQLSGFSLIGRLYSAGRLLELAAALLVFVIAVTLREILVELRSNSQ